MQMPRSLPRGFSYPAVSLVLPTFSRTPQVYPGPRRPNLDWSLDAIDYKLWNHLSTKDKAAPC